MSYQPTLEDMMCLFLEQPEKFSARLQTQRSLINAANQPAANAGAVDEAVRAHYADYLRNGGEPLTETRVSQVSRMDDTIHDTVFGAANCGCVSESPCCLVSGEVVDAVYPSRKVEWPNRPSSDKPKTLWLIADSQEGNEYYAEVNVDWKGSACRSEYKTAEERQYLPAIQIERSGTDTLQQSDNSETYKVYLNQSTGVLDLLRSVLPDAIVIPLAIVDRILSLPRFLSGLDRASFSPRQCAASTDMRQALQVGILPQMGVEGSISVGAKTIFSLNGISGEVSAEGSITGKIAQYEISANAEKSAYGDSNERSVDMSTAEREPGFLGLIGSMFNQLSQAVSHGSSDPSDSSQGSDDTPDSLMRSNDFTSSITLYKTLKVDFCAIELRRKQNTPYLELAWVTGTSNGINTILTIGVEGKIDLVDLLVRGVFKSGRVAREIAELRFKAANGETVDGTVEMNLTLAAEGNVEHNVSTQATTITVTTQEDLEEQLNQLQHEFTGTLKIVGEAEIKVHLGLEYWLVSARVGVNGTLHTAWTWEVKTIDKQRKKRFYFEGLKVSVEAYAEIEYDDEPATTEEAESEENEGWGGDTSATATENLELDPIQRQILQSQKVVEEMRARHAEQASTNSQDGETYEILKPTVAEVTEESPPWDDF